MQGIVDVERVRLEGHRKCLTTTAVGVGFINILETPDLLVKKDPLVGQPIDQYLGRNTLPAAT